MSEPHNETRHLVARRRQVFGDYGAPKACWDAGFDGGPRWIEHLRYCSECCAMQEKAASTKKTPGAKS